MTTIERTRHLTLEQFLARRDTKPASEYVDGKVYRKAMPNEIHGFIQFMMSAILAQFIMPRQLGRPGSEVRFNFGPAGDVRSYVPDLSFIVAQRAPLDGRLMGGSFRGAPDLAIEILSPNDRAGRLRRKVKFYLANGVRLLWVIDPKKLLVTVYTPPDSRQVLTINDTLGGGDVLPGFSVPVAEIFPPMSADEDTDAAVTS